MSDKVMMKMDLGMRTMAIADLRGTSDEAIESGALDVEKSLLKPASLARYPIQRAIEDDDLPLFLRLVAGDRSSVEVGQETDINAQAWDLSCALMLSIHRKNLVYLKSLLARPDILVNLACHANAWTALMYACFLGEVEHVRILLAHRDIDACAADRRGRTALFFACNWFKASIVELLFQSRKDLNFYATGMIREKSAQGGGFVDQLFTATEIALMKPASSGFVNYDSESIKRIMKCYERTLPPGRSPCPSLHDAIKRRWFAEYKDWRNDSAANLNTLDLEGLAPLQVACRQGWDLALMGLLEKPEVRVNLIDENGWSAVFYLIASGTHDREILNRLMRDKRLVLDVADKFGCSPLWYAVSMKRYDLVCWIVASGQGSIGQSFKGMNAERCDLTPFELAHSLTNQQIFKLLEKWRDHRAEAIAEARAAVGFVPLPQEDDDCVVDREALGREMQAIRDGVAGGKSFFEIFAREPVTSHLSEDDPRDDRHEANSAAEAEDDSDDKESDVD